jgi:glycosyltransferase involved in cell wall biosynthesis
MVTDLPRLLIASEVTFSQSGMAGMGAGRTLSNLFDSYPAEQLMLFSPENFLKSQPTAPPFNQQVVAFPGAYFPTITNRTGKFINPLITAVNLQLFDWLPIPNSKKLEAFAPEVILVCPITSLSLLMGYKLTQHFQCPSLIYFMDDWLTTVNLWWLSGNVQVVGYQLLKEAAGWLMISKQLEADLSHRYHLVPQHSLIVHNPVDLSEKKLPDEVTPHEGTFRVAYAGSIWPMHYDALAAVAEAIFELIQEGKDIELILYTDQYFWNSYKDNWENWQVVYGSLIHYQELDYYLKQADLLLVATSFLPENAHIVRSSVLTKLTDYMAAGKPILSCGPDYSACNHFIKEWNCGLVCESNQVIEIKKCLLNTLQNKFLLYPLAQKAFHVVQDNFEKSNVSFSLYQFVKKIHQIGKSS